MKIRIRAVFPLFLNDEKCLKRRVKWSGNSSSMCIKTTWEVWFRSLPSFLENIAHKLAQSGCHQIWVSAVSERSAGSSCADRQIQLFTFSLWLSLQTQRSSCLQYWQLSSVWSTRCLHTAVWPNYPKYLGMRFKTWMEKVLWATGRNGIWWPEICTGTSRCCETSRCFSTQINVKMLCYWT